MSSQKPALSGQTLHLDSPTAAVSRVNPSEAPLSQAPPQELEMAQPAMDRLGLLAEHYWLLARSSHEMVAWLDPQGCYIYLNPAAQALFHQGVSFLDDAYEEDRVALTEIWHRILRGATIRDFEYRICLDRCTVRSLSWNAAPIDDGHGNLIFVSAIAKDLTAGGEYKAILDISGLSRREHEVLLLATQGYTNLNIANRLAITESTVKFHLNSIFKKTGVGNRTELACRVHIFEPKT